MDSNELKAKAKALGRVVVLMGGMSSEREVSLSSGSGVLKALQAAGADAEGFDPGLEPIEKIRGKYDRAMISLHGRFGEDGTVQGALEYMQMPYTGPGVRASAIAIDKVMTRRVWEAAGLPVALGFVATRVEDAATVIKALGSSVVVKPSGEGSSIGVTKLRNCTVEELEKALDEALKLDPEVLVEERCFGREFTVGILDGKCLPIIEIKAPEGDYDYQNKYFGNAVSYDCPAKISAEKTAEIMQACEEGFAALQARGWGRIDVMMREDGSFILLELNTSPGMTPHSLVPMAARAVGMSYEELCVHVAGSANLDFRIKKQIISEE